MSGGLTQNAAAHIGEPPARVLVVDDRPTTRAIVKGVLGSSEFEVVEADSGARAIDLVERQPFDLVILDILMPDMDGLTVLKTLRSKYSEAELPVIMATVKHNSGDMVEALEHGANDYVTKPIDFPVLLARIRRQLARKRHEDALRVASSDLVVAVEQKSSELARVGGVVEKLYQERRSAEEARLSTQQQLRDFTEVAGDWFWEMDADLKLSYVSSRFAEATGLRPEEVLGRTCEEVFGGDGASLERFRSLALRRPFDGLELLWTKPDGAQRALCWGGKPIFDDDGAFRGYRGAGRDVTEAHQLSEELSYRSRHDALTGLVNREEFERRLRRALESVRTHGAGPVAGVPATEHVLCYLDLDQFKLINDTCGNVAGDELLRETGTILTDQIRRRDTVARLGGDEFGILMEHCSLRQAQRVANGIREAIDRFQFVWNERRYHVGASIGIALIDQLTDGVGSAMRAAETACYAAKEQGRNRIHVFRDDDAEFARRRGEIQWVGRINQALEEGRFQLFFQPIVPVGRRAEGAHYELLLRMRDESGKLVSAGVFLPAAERYNLAIKVDTWVVRESLAWLQRHPEHLAQLHQCAINLSGLSLGDETFLDFVMATLRESCVPARKLCFEVTETAAVRNLVRARRFISALKGLGCLFSLDDFGSGLSSFAYLKNLPVDIVKIDGMFVRDIANDPIDLAMVRSINDIGHVMRKQTVAEFVEDEAILEKLREAGVDYAQGYVIGAPQPLRD